MAARDHWFDNARIHALLPELATLEEDDARCFARIATRRVMRPAAMRTAYSITPTPIALPTLTTDH